MVFLRNSNEKIKSLQLLVINIFLIFLFLSIIGCTKEEKTIPTRIHEDSLAATLLNEGLVSLDQNGIDIYYQWNSLNEFQDEEKIVAESENLFSPNPILELDILKFFYLYSNSPDDISTVLNQWEKQNPQETEEEKIIAPEIEKTIDFLIEKREKLIQKEGLFRIRNINIFWKQYIDLLNRKKEINPKRKRKLRNIDTEILKIYIQMSLNGYHPLSKKGFLALPATGQIIPVKKYSFYGNGEIKSVVPLVPVKIKLQNRVNEIKCTGRIDFYKKGKIKSFYTKNKLQFYFPDNNRIDIKGGRITLYPNEKLQSITNVKPFSLYLPNGHVSLAKSVRYSINGELLQADFPVQHMTTIRLPDGTIVRSISNEYTRLGKLKKVYPYNDVSIFIPGGEFSKIKGSNDSLENGIEYYPSGTLKRVFLKETISIFMPQFEKKVKLKNELRFNRTGQIISGELVSPQDIMLNGNPAKIEGQFQLYSSGNLASADIVTYDLKSINPSTFIGFSEKNAPAKIILYPSGKLKKIRFDKKSSVYIKSGNQTYLKSADYSDSGQIKEIKLYSGTIKVPLPNNLGTITGAQKISFHKNESLAKTTTIHSFSFPLNVKTKLKIITDTEFATYSDGAIRSFYFNTNKSTPFYIKGILLAEPGMVELYPNGSLKNYTPINPVDIMLPEGLLIKTKKRVEYYPGGFLKKVEPIHSIKINHRNIPYRFKGILFFKKTGTLSKIEFTEPTEINLGDSGVMVQTKSSVLFTPDGILYQFNL